MEVFSNKIFGNYRTLEYLGCGNFSAVYISEHIYTKEKVALKIAHTNDKQIIEEFNKIVKSGLKGLLKIQHKDIIGIREYFKVSENGTDFFIMVLDLIKGKSLDKTPAVEVLAIQDKLQMFIRICDAIAYAHEFEYTDQNEYQSFRIKGLFHGDIKPNNILVDDHYNPKIIDFSFLNLKKAAEEHITKAGNKDVNTGAFGTEGYMAPEQEKTGVINEKTDIYSLGIVLKQLIYGYKYDKQVPADPIYKKLDALIDKSTNVDPTKRFDSVRLLQRELEKLVASRFTFKKWLPHIAATALIIILAVAAIRFNSDAPISDPSNESSLSQHSDDAQRGIKPLNTDASQLDITKNKYYALLIGNNNYQYWKKLQYPINDVEKMKTTLVENYTFDEENIKIIKDGTYEKIYKGFESFTDNGPNTYLLIYYAGHGKYDKVTDKAALIPVDAEENSDSKNITSDIIKDLLKKCRIHNILFISDACYLGAMASRGELNDSVKQYDLSSFKNFASKQSRKFISSGAKETVPDKSYFNEYLIKYLKSNPNKITFEYTLFNEIIEPIRNNTQTSPVYGIFFDTRDEGGHFFFVRR